jgi:hypothetical protein
MSGFGASTMPKGISQSILSTKDIFSGESGGTGEPILRKKLEVSD